MSVNVLHFASLASDGIGVLCCAGLVVKLLAGAVMRYAASDID